MIQNSEIAANTAALAGGGVSYVNSSASAQTNATDAVLALVNTTVSGNSVTSSTGNAVGVSVAGNTALSLDNSTIAFNKFTSATTGAVVTRSSCIVNAAAAAAATREPTHSIDSSIIAMTNAGAITHYDLSNAGAVFANAWPVNTSVTPRTDAALSDAGNRTGTDPQMLALALNGGITRSHAVAPTSPAIDVGSNSLSLTGDQRGTGFTRIYGTTADIGTYEYNPLIVKVAEFHNSALDAYFISGRPAEQYVIDGVAGFVRTGSTFQSKSTLATDLSAAEDSVCRYYINTTTPFASSHFYGFKATYCTSIGAAVASGAVTGFTNEGYDFTSYKPISATTCPVCSAGASLSQLTGSGGQQNAKSSLHHINHTRDSMTALGWSNEGVAFCATSAATVQ